MSSIFHGNWNVNAPAAGTVLATWTPGSLGTYEIDIYTELAGVAVVGTDSDNVGLYKAGSPDVLIAACPIPGLVNLQPVKVTLFATLLSTDTLKLCVIGAGSLLSTYRGLMVGRVK